MPGNETIRGHLEKRKDWIRRTRDHQEKSADIKKLKRSARERNPDEFHFHMLRSQIGFDGTHHDLETEEEEKSEAQRLLSDVSDINFVQFKLGMERKKIEKLKAVLHFCDETEKPQNKHIIFAEDEEEARNFDPRQYFNTSEQFLTRTFNRPIEGDARKSLSVTEKRKLKETEKERRRLYAELCKRMERERELTVVLQKLELKRDLALSKKSELKPKLIKKGDARRAAIYKWQYERKK
ncbi:hypothetical protein niasHS_007544 [Heterodera schachtii]|uniref:U3 small nucleolar RNA-associated protein 11 n=1 Tax=Heterodera schachtii TaxID=97005 RepID=A0ABD2JXU0_HETSC